MFSHNFQILAPQSRIWVNKNLSSSNPTAELQPPTCPFLQALAFDAPKFQQLKADHRVQASTNLKSCFPLISTVAGKMGISYFNRSRKKTSSKDLKKKHSHFSVRRFTFILPEILGSPQLEVLEEERLALQLANNLFTAGFQVIPAVDGT